MMPSLRECLRPFARSVLLAVLAFPATVLAQDAKPSAVAAEDAATVSEDALRAREVRLDYIPIADREKARRARLAASAKGGDPAFVAREDGALASIAVFGKPIERKAAAQELVRRYPGRAAGWNWLALATLEIKPRDFQIRRANERLRMDAAVNALVTLADDDVPRQANAHGTLARVLREGGRPRLAIKALRASLDLVPAATPDGPRAQQLAALVREHGFRVLSDNVDADVARPRVCFTFSDRLGDSVTGTGRAGDWVRVRETGGSGARGGDWPVTAKDGQLCVDGLSHGSRYEIVIRADTPSQDPAERLVRDVTTRFYVRDRKPVARFATNAYVLPAGSGATIPVTTINTDGVEVAVHRVDERALAELQNDGTLLAGLTRGTVRQLSGRLGSEVFKGSVTVEERINAEIVTAVPVAAITGGLVPGLHVLTARPDNANPDEYQRATQWFVVSDIGLSSFAATDGFHVIARSLASAEPLAGVRLTLVARNNRELGTAVTDAGGHVRLAPGLLRGEGGDAPALLTARRDDDFVFLDMAAAGFDLTDRGVAGRAPAGPLDVFLTSERGIYRPGGTVHLTGTMRDAQARAVEGVRLVGRVTRPDGVERARRVIEADAAGGFAWSVALPQGAARGAWTVSVHADPDGAALASARVQVADFEPERIDFDLDANDAAMRDGAAPEVRLAARYLFGVPGANLAIEGETIVRAGRSVPGHEGYLFGLAEETVRPVRTALDPARTDGEGRAVLAVPKLDLPSTTRPLEAELAVRVADTNGRPVERRMDLPVPDADGRIGIRPRFEGAVGDGGSAAFDVVALRAGTPVPAMATWQLERISTDFQWYRTGGRWNYEPVRRRARVASGEVAVTAGGPAAIAAAVEWGEYALTVTAPGMAPASHVFNAGWYVAAKGVETPDIARITLDKPRYAVGDTARVFIEPRFAGLADVLVMDERVVARVSAAIPAEGGTVELPVTREWGPGAYVTAIVVRPMDLDAKVMPGRAIGVAHAKVEPGPAALAVSLDAPARVAPRSSFDVGVSVSGLQPGESAFMTLSMVDEGVLNVTGFEPPSLQDHYFGQRRLGVSIRDLYSTLIDRMAGAPGSVRSGGDGSLGSDVEPPAIEEVVARFSGLVEVGEDGRATVSFDVPDFDGSLRLDALVWSRTGVGEASTKVVARDPVVVAVNKPRFLQPGDEARISIDATNVELGAMDGEAIEMALVAPSGRIAVTGPTTFSLAMPEGERRSVDVDVAALGVGEVRFGLTLTLPDGRVIEKAFAIPVRSNAPQVMRTSSIRLAPGGRLSLTSALFDDLVPGTANATVSVTGVGRVDVAGLVRALDDYPYLCTEQRTSRAFPLVALPRPLVDAALKGREGDIDERVAKAVSGIVANQSSSGSFGLWNAGATSLWLDAYVTDFLTRAKERGFDVPDGAFGLAIDNLRNQLQYLPPAGDRDPAAYASYVLARNGRAAIGDLRYMAEAPGQRLSPLGRAHLAAALGLYGETTRARDMMRDVLARSTASAAWRAGAGGDDFGSRLRDQSAIVAISLEAGLGDDEPGWRELLRIAGERHRETAHTSTQEDAWTLLAAAAALDRAPPRLSVAGTPHEGPLVATFDERTVTSGTAIRNIGDEPTTAEVSVRGVPRVAPAASANGYRVERRFYTMEGTPADARRVAKGTRLVAMLEIVPIAAGQARVVVDDPLPAGFEIDDPNLMTGGRAPRLDAIGLTTAVTHTEFRADRFVASFEKREGDTDIRRFAYIVRAVTPGRYVHPAASAVDMYEPVLRGRTGAGRVEVVD